MTIAYDANGNTANDGARTFVWDGANRLQQVTLGGVTTTLGYDASGGRARKQAGAAVTLYPSADVEINVPASGTPALNDYTRYPHIHYEC